MNPADRDLDDCLDRFFDAGAKVPVPPVKFRPAIEELDVHLLQAALPEDAVAFLRDCYRRMG